MQHRLRFWSTVKGLLLASVYVAVHARHGLECLLVRLGMDRAVEKLAKWRIRRLEKAPFSSLLAERLGLGFELMARVYEHRKRYDVAKGIVEYHAKHPYFARFEGEGVYLKSFKRMLRSGQYEIASHYAARAREMAAGDSSRQEFVERIIWALTAPEGAPATPPIQRDE